MERLHGLEALPRPGGPAVVTVGFFDGVHVGHRAVLRRTVDAARQREIPSVAVTFDRHPREVLTPGQEPRLLTTVQRKADLIDEAGIDALLVLEFTEDFSRWPAEDFIARVLADGLHADHCVMGANFTFGHRAAGTVELLIETGPRWGFTAERVELVELEGRRVSSSSIRDALAEGDLGWPLLALGRRFVLDGTVVGGAGRGRGLGFPTANLRTWPRLLLPGRGIYAGRAVVDGRAHVAAISVGTNPTFGVEPLHVEAYLLEFDEDIVGRPISIEFWAYLRDEERFETPDELSEAIGRDVRRTRDLVTEP
ncbi:MAG TPA: bifunctional riboflavin kinase/FAD synthetase [Actinomycetota bacterium]|nr:bifunctional riboflavin kinase/FAD synthetase [Actinomycetota bacterium]